MDGQALRRLVEQIVREVLARQTPSAPGVPARVLTFVFTGSEIGERDGRNLLAQMRNRFPCEVVITPCYRDLYGEKWLREDAGDCPIHTKLDSAEREKLLRRTGALIFPHPTRTTVAKAASGIADSLPTTLLLGALLQGIPIAAGTGDCDPGDWPRETPAAVRSGPRSLGQVMQDHLRTLGMWGIEIRRGGELLHIVEKLAKDMEDHPGRLAVPNMGRGTSAGERRFWTASDIQRMARNKQFELSPAPRDIVTDEARSVAADLGVSIL
ncbi:hypothetical protein KQI84_09390 [bacterium]|nr:hypothetical protein [bacterium]